MKYEIMFYGGLVITIITLILAIISFLKLNVAEALLPYQSLLLF